MVFDHDVLLFNHLNLRLARSVLLHRVVDCLLIAVQSAELPPCVVPSVSHRVDQAVTLGQDPHWGQELLGLVDVLESR